MAGKCFIEFGCGELNVLGICIILSSGRERSDQRSPIRRLTIICLLACADQVLHQKSKCPKHSLQKSMVEKNGGKFRAFYIASDDRISLPEA